MTKPLTNQVMLVTGANAGLGYQVALALARRGAHVVMACRNHERAQQAYARLLAEVPDAHVTTLLVDVAEPESIRAFARSYEQQVGQLDVLIHNAGRICAPLARNSLGHELHLATNYLGPFALTGALLPCFHAARGGRIVHVGSLASRFCKLPLGELQEERDYRAARAYARSKLALLVHCVELNRRLQRSGSKVIALAAHPGFAPTEGARNFSSSRQRGPLGRWLAGKGESMLASVAQAATPIIYAACAQDVRGGDYYGPGGWLEISGAPAPARLNRRALDEALGRALWTSAQELSGMRYLAEH